MKNFFTRLIDIIGQENQVLDRLANLAQEKKQSIILGKIEELDNLIRSEGMVLAELEKLEDARFRLQEEIKADSSEEAAVSAKTILETAQKECPEIYQDMEDTISYLAFNLTRLKAANLYNSELLEHSLHHISALEAVIHGDVPGTYSSKGRQVDERLIRRLNSLVDKKI